MRLWHGAVLLVSSLCLLIFSGAVLSQWQSQMIRYLLEDAKPNKKGWGIFLKGSIDARIIHPKSSSAPQSPSAQFWDDVRMCGLCCFCQLADCCCLKFKSCVFSGSSFATTAAVAGRRSLTREFRTYFFRLVWLQVLSASPALRAVVSIALELLHWYLRRIAVQWHWNHTAVGAICSRLRLQHCDVCSQAPHFFASPSGAVHSALVLAVHWSTDTSRIFRTVGGMVSHSVLHLQVLFIQHE